MTKAVTPSEPPKPHKSPLNAIVIVAALGYFVDIYDLLLFFVVRDPSLKDLGVPAAEMTSVGLMLLDWQMAGLLLGGLLWGILGDKRGRLSVLFGSIITYSLANIANGFVTDITTYAILRFIAGIGLAGELGAGITLVSETMDKESRGWGTTLVASFGVLGAVVAALVGDLLPWRTAYFVGGGLGLLLLVLRFSTYESGMFEHMKKAHIKGARFRAIFGSLKRTGKFLACIGIGVPIWFAIGLLVGLSKEMSTALQTQAIASGAQAVLWAYLGLALGDFTSGFLSQKLRSRKKAVFIFMGLLALAVGFYFSLAGAPLWEFYLACGLIGFAAGYWALFVTIASEQFGTDIRATVTTSIPNFVRGAVIPITLAYRALHTDLGVIESVLLVGAVCFALALWSLYSLSETFGKDLDYTEEV
jgi:putative MFS transporter